MTTENWVENHGTVKSCANFPNFQSKKSTGTSKNQSENRGHLYYPDIKGDH